MPKSSKQISVAIGRFLEENGSTAREMARHVGVSEATVSSWRSGKQNIANKHWVKLRDLLAPYLGSGATAHASAPATHNNAVSPGDVSSFPTVPVIGIARAADYEACLQSVTEFAEEIAEDRVAAFPLARSGDIALVVEGHSMAPWYPPGTVLLVRPGEFAERGDIVVARIEDGSVIVKRYQRRNGIVELEALNEGEDGETIVWRVKEEPGKVLWMWPVISSMRDERAVRHLAAKLGK